MIASARLSGKDMFSERASLFSRKYFVMIVVYADETGTQGLRKGGKEPAPGVYGFMDVPEGWERFRGAWSAALKKYGVDYFHFRELNPLLRLNPGNPYFGWDNEKVDDFIYDMAIAASCGPTPFGGYVSIKALYGGRTDKEARDGSYAKSFEQFFNDFTNMMDCHFPNQKDKATFVFDDNENEQWIAILNSEIKKAKKRDRRIGEYSFIDAKSGRGMPCQASDLLAYVNRQQAETTFETGHYQKTRLLDLIISRNAFPKEHPRSMYAGYSDTDWTALIKMLRDDKKLKHTRDVAQGLGKQQYYPFRDNALLRLHMAQWVAKNPRLFL